MSDKHREELLEALQEQLRSEYEDLRGIHANSKGDQYERRLSKLIERYVGGQYDVRTRAALIDSEGESFEQFDFQTGEEEIDLVAVFKQSNPQIVFETGNEEPLSWVPYEGLAFLCEVKSALTKSALEADLDKLEKVRQIEQAGDDRFGPNVGGEYTIEEPLRCLVYDSAQIADDTLEDILSDRLAEWDLVLIAEEDTLILNADLPMAGEVIPSSDSFGPSELDESLPPEVLDFVEEETGIDTDPEMVTLEKGLLWFITTLALSIPDPLSVSTVNSVISLSQGLTVNYGASTSVGEENEE